MPDAGFIPPCRICVSWLSMAFKIGFDWTLLLFVPPSHHTYLMSNIIIWLCLQFGSFLNGEIRKLKTQNLLTSLLFASWLLCDHCFIMDKFHNRKHFNRSSALNLVSTVTCRRNIVYKIETCFSQFSIWFYMINIPNWNKNQAPLLTTNIIVKQYKLILETQPWHEL